METSASHCTVDRVTTSAYLELELSGNDLVVLPKWWQSKWGKNAVLMKVREEQERNTLDWCHGCQAPQTRAGQDAVSYLCEGSSKSLTYFLGLYNRAELLVVFMEHIDIQEKSSVAEELISGDLKEQRKDPRYKYLNGVAQWYKKRKAINLLWNTVPRISQHNRCRSSIHPASSNKK